MNKKLFKTLLSTAALGLCITASTQAGAQGQKDSVNAAAASYGYALHNGSRDPYTDGARSVQEPRNPYADGARSVQEPRSPYTDGARGAAVLDLAGRDLTGVSAPPSRSGIAASDLAA
ncbi:hypothetical protein [Cupriavidus campinensis]